MGLLSMNTEAYEWGGVCYGVQTVARVKQHSNGKQRPTPPHVHLWQLEEQKVAAWGSCTCGDRRFFSGELLKGEKEPW